jgi:hypothetical protein
MDGTSDSIRGGDLHQAFSSAIRSTGALVRGAECAISGDVLP